MRSRVQLLPVTEQVWCFRQRSYVCCSYAVVDDDGVVLVDAGMTSDAAPILNGLDMLGRSPADVHTILLSHWHNDHAAGAARMKTLSGARVHYHGGDRPYFMRETARGGFPGWLSKQVPERGPLVLARGLLSAATSTAVAADALVRNGDLLLGQFRVLETPGHTPGHVAYFYEPDGVLFAGDALAVVGGKLRFMARPVTLELDDARASMAAFLQLPIRYVCPGHRAPLTENVAAQLDSLRERVAAPGWPLLG
ncbi:MBL fold metallo-hydrolase [Mycobacterium asiaticum]|uniref:MBL fold metallo-hydrolase n=1 Tax=Mycobacterium asiaticum TaxID=1790 RepID=UPI000AFF50C1|nr:MBL fold metallo-hydrolase [Mycobacterium asiaticum]